METKNCSIINIDDDLSFAVRQAENIYLNGGVFIYPTDTLYGIGGNPFDKQVENKINKIKNREEQKRFILLFPNLTLLQNHVEFIDQSQKRFLNNIWPGPISVIFNLKPDTQKLLGFKTAAIRIPDNNFCTQLLSKLNKPIISSSVNKSDEKPLSDHKEIINEFEKDVDAIFFTSKEPSKLASTLIDLTETQPKLIREGTIKFVELLKKLG